MYIFLAVQHERGPRKPKLQKDGTTQALVGSSHPNSNNNNSNMASLTSSVTGLHAQHGHGVHSAGLHIGHHPLHHQHSPRGKPAEKTSGKPQRLLLQTLLLHIKEQPTIVYVLIKKM